MPDLSGTTPGFIHLKDTVLTLNTAGFLSKIGATRVTAMFIWVNTQRVPLTQTPVQGIANIG